MGQWRAEDGYIEDRDEPEVPSLEDDDDDVVDATYDEPDYDRDDADEEDSLSYIEREDYEAAESNEEDDE